MASTQIETVSTGLDKAKMAFAALLVLAGIAGFYFLSRQGTLVQWGGLAAGLVLAALVFLTAEPGKRLTGFARDSWREMHKVVWPARKSSLQTTLFVFVFSIAISLFMWFSDQILQWVLYDLVLGWK